MKRKFKLAVERNFFLKEYLINFKRFGYNLPEFHEILTKEMGGLDSLDLIYPVGDPIFVHVYGDKQKGFKYDVIEPQLNEEEQKLYDMILDRLFEKSGFEPIKKDSKSFETYLEGLLNDVVRIDDNAAESKKKSKLIGFKLVQLSPEENFKIRYQLRRNIIENGILEPLIRDPYIEDINCVGLDNINIVHKIFRTLKTNLRFSNIGESENYLRGLSEKIGKPLNEARPIIDSALPDGSRLNLIFSRDVSVKGPSFTIRKFSEEPLSITQLIAWNTLSSEIAAYIWLCVENGINVFVCGETASGKTTTLNAILPFIYKNSKIISVEDTAEVQPPHDVWQQFLTRETGIKENRIDMFALLNTALRSRPDYILVGEIRGSEGSVAFQAMQAGKPVMSTFHAASIQSLIRRFTGHPINVPIKFLDNLNLAIFQNAVYKDSKIIRKISSVNEIITYSEELGGILTREAFVWNPSDDSYRFRARFNSYILENIIAKKLGFGEKKEIYNELALRKRILDQMIGNNIFSYRNVLNVIQSYQQSGIDNLPFGIEAITN